MNIQLDGAAQTVGAATVTLIELPIGANAVFQVEAVINARDQGNGNGALFRRLGAGKQGALGSLVTIGAVQQSLTLTDAGLATAAISFSVVGGSTLRVSVVGVAGRTINWYGELLGYMVS